MKKLISIIVAAAIIIAALPIINGILMQMAVNSYFANINEIYKDTGTGYSLEVISYNRGLFSSDIEWKANLGKLKTLYGIEEVIFTGQAKHGFTGVVATTDMEKNLWFSNFMANKLGGKNPFSISTCYSLFGAIETTLEISPFSFWVEEEAISVSEGKIIIATDRNLKKFVSKGKWDGFNISDRVVFGEMAIASELEMISTFLWAGDASFEADSFSITEGGTAAAVKNIRAKYILDTDIDKNTMSAESSFFIESITTADTTVNGAKGTIAVKNVDASAYEEFMKQYMQVVSEALSAAEEMEDEGDAGKAVLEQQMAAAGLQMMAGYEKLLKKDLEIRFAGVEVKLAEGDIKGDITLRLLKDMTLMQFAPIVHQPNLVFDILYLKTDISLPASCVGEKPMLFSPLFPGMKTGVFVSKGDMNYHKAETKDGRLMVNDQEVDLEQLRQQ